MAQDFLSAGLQLLSATPDGAGGGLRDRHLIERRLRACRWDQDAMARLRLSVARAGLTPHVALLHDDELLNYCVELVRQRVLRPIGAGIGASAVGLSDAERSRVEEERVLREFAGREYTFRVGRQVVRLASVAQWGDLGRSGNYTIVPKEEAASVLTSLADTAGVTASERSALVEAVALLAETGRRLTSGLILLDHTPARVLKREAASSAAATPSQLRAANKPAVQHWVQFKVADLCGNPLGGMPYKLLPPGGVEEKGRYPDSGLLRKDGIPAGNYTLTLGELTSAGWAVDDAGVRGPLPASQSLTMRVQSGGLNPGASAKFEVFHLCDEEPGRAIASASGKVDGEGVIEATFTLDASKETGAQCDVLYCCSVGSLWLKSPSITLMLPRLVRPRWSVPEAWVGDALTCAVDCPGVPDGESVNFEVRRLDNDASVTTIAGSVSGGQAQADWPSTDPDPDGPETHLYFIACWQGQKVHSRAVRLKDRVELVFNDPEGSPISNLSVSIEYPDGVSRVFRTDGAGRIRLTDSRAAHGKVSIAGLATDDFELSTEQAL
jgi:hypothetical protein